MTSMVMGRGDALLRMRVAFDLVPASALVRPEDRCLSPFHVLTIIGRGAPMAQAVCRTVGGFWLRSVAELQPELDAREEQQAARLAGLRPTRREPGAVAVGSDSPCWNLCVRSS